MQPKTLIGKNGYLFLINDSARELDIHCNNFLFIEKNSLDKYNFNNFLLFVYPDKSVIFKNFLPDNYISKYRPGIIYYKSKLGDKVIDLYDILEYEEDIYYKTDTHINLKGNYIVYKYFIMTINYIFNLEINIKSIDLKKVNCELSKYGIGDLLYFQNIGNQNILNRMDTYYYTDEFSSFLGSHINNNIKILNYNLIDITSSLNNSTITWDIISKNIINHRSNDINSIDKKVIIFHDSFLLNILPIYFDIFKNIYFIKNKYNKEIINKINPDFVFEFRVERFLN